MLAIENLVAGNIIIMQKKVFDSLPAPMKSGFIKSPLNDRRIRNDPKAEYAYYQIISTLEAA